MIGRTIAHYRIESKLGEGSDEAARSRFRKEALALSQLNHPHICTVFEVGEAGDQAYIAMEPVVERARASRRIARRNVDPIRRPDCRCAGARARAGSHHRDLKSSNVVITRDQAEPATQGLQTAADERLA